MSRKSLIMSAWVGVLSGAASALFLHAIDWATRTRESHAGLIYFLPLGGLLSGFLYHRFGRDIERGHNLILEEVHEPRAVLPRKMAPIIFIASTLTHLFGGSAGREGAAVQISASLSDQISRWIPFSKEERLTLLMAGMGAGFGASVGAPLAGMLFGLEVISLRGHRWKAALSCGIASCVAFATASALHAPHSKYLKVQPSTHFIEALISVALAGALFGLAASLFVRLTHFVESLFDRLSIDPILRPVLGGALVILAYALVGSRDYAGLGIRVIEESFAIQHPFQLAPVKLLVTALTVGCGFKGGEFIPLVFIGATLGSALSTLLPASPSLLGAVGFASVFGAASKTPWACTVMAIELFGPSVTLYALVGCRIAYIVSGRHRLYRSQVPR